jgi:hypothetical protein
MRVQVNQDGSALVYAEIILERGEVIEKEAD